MGTESKIEHYHGAGEAPNINVVNRYGAPVRSLYATRNVLSVGQEITITDDDNNTVYRSVSKPVSVLDKTEITDGTGKPIAHFNRKKYSLRERHILTMGNGMEILLEKEVMHIVREVTNITELTNTKELSWQIRGSKQRLNFEILDSDKRAVAIVSQKVISKHEKYCIDIYDADAVDIICSVMIILMHIIRDRNLVSSRKIIKITKRF